MIITLNWQFHENAACYIMDGKMTHNQTRYYKEICNIAEKKGWLVISDRYDRDNTKMKFKCSEGHERDITPGSFKSKNRKSGCLVCSGQCSIESERKFRENITLMGGIVIGIYEGNKIPVHCICSNGHECLPTPNNIGSGRGMCLKCVDRCPIESEKNFRKSISLQGGEVIGKYRNVHTAVECLCVKKHKCYPQPASIQQGRGMCLKCVNHCPIECERRFIESITWMGGVVVGKYKYSNVPVDCICVNNHECSPQPASIQQGHGMCLKCVNHCPVQSEENFLKAIAEMKGTVVGKYRYSDIPVECICSKGHKCQPRPAGIQQGQGMCSKCRQSHGERLITKFFDELKISYEHQARLPEYPSYKYDFLTYCNGKHIYVEFDGIQHFDPNTHYGKNGLFEAARRRDIKKTKLVVEHYKARMIRITYRTLKCDREEIRGLFIEALYTDKPLLFIDVIDKNLHISVNAKIYSWLIAGICIVKQSRLDIEESVSQLAVKQSRLDIEELPAKQVKQSRLDFD
jgi:hypothetical protein